MYSSYLQISMYCFTKIFLISWKHFTLNFCIFSYMKYQILTTFTEKNILWNLDFQEFPLSFTVCCEMENESINKDYHFRYKTDITLVQHLEAGFRNAIFIWRHRKYYYSLAAHLRSSYLIYRMYIYQWGNLFLAQDAQAFTTSENCDKRLFSKKLL